MLVSRLGGSRRTSIIVAKAIFDLRTLMKVIEHKVIGLEMVMELIETLDKETIIAIKTQQHVEKNCPTTLGESK
jgi:hypothetical protein